MITRLIILFFFVAGVACAQTPKSRADLYTQIGSQLASGQQLTAAQLRAVLQDIVASADNFTTDGVKATSSALAAGLAGKSDTSHSHGNATTGAAGFMSAADKAKLDGVASGATANASDATLLARANHTGTQAISTVTGLQAALDAKEGTQTAASQPEAEAGSGTVLRSWTPERIKQAILALTPPGGTTTWGGIIGTLADQTDLQAALDAKSGTGHSHSDATTSAAGFMSAADKTKLNGIANGATANSSDATLLARANHTGTQAISTVSGLQAALDGKEATQTAASQAEAEAGTSTALRSWTPERIKQAIAALVAWANITGKPSTFTPSTHASAHQSGGGDAIKLDDLAAPDDNTDLDATTSAHGLMSKSDKTKLNGIASGATANSSDATLLARANHTGTQAISTVSGLQAALDAKADASSVAGTAKSSVPLVFYLTIDAVADSMNYGIGFVGAAFTISEIRFVHVGTTSTPSIAVTVKHHTDRSNAGNSVVSGGTTVTSTTTGNSVTSSFNDATVPANSFLWITTASKSGTTDKLEVIVRGTYD